MKAKFKGQKGQQTGLRTLVRTRKGIPSTEIREKKNEVEIQANITQGKRKMIHIELGKGDPKYL